MKLHEKEIAYLSGFLDGDACLLSQIVRDSNYKRGFYIRISINFYQKTKRHWFLLHLKHLLKDGSIVTRKDGMSVYTIVGKEPVRKMLILFKPHLKIKKSLARLILRIIEDKGTVTTDAEFIKVCELVDKTAELTDSKKRTITSQTVRDFLISRAQTKIKLTPDPV